MRVVLKVAVRIASRIDDRNRASCSTLQNPTPLTCISRHYNVGLRRSTDE